MQETFKLAFQLVLKSANPSIVSQTEITSTGTRSYEAGSVRLTTKMPTKIDIIRPQSLIVNNIGATYADIVMTVNGPLTNPRIENITTGKIMSFTRTLTVGQYIKIDSLDGSIVNESGADITSSMDNGSEIIKLISGLNEIYLSSNENNGATNPIATRIAPTEVIEVKHRATYL
jgi:hypothetical protein